MPYADFNWYKEVYKGFEMGEEQFSSVALLASKYLDKITFGKIDEVSTGVKLAMCAVADKMFTLAVSSNIASESNDGYSISYKNQCEEKVLYKAASLFLPQELLYRGVEI